MEPGGHPEPFTPREVLQTKVRAILSILDFQLQSRCTLSSKDGYSIRTYMLKPGGGSVMVPGLPAFVLCGALLTESANVRVRRERDEMRVLNIARTQSLREYWRKMGNDLASFYTPKDIEKNTSKQPVVVINGQCGSC